MILELDIYSNLPNAQMLVALIFAQLRFGAFLMTLVII